MSIRWVIAGMCAVIGAYWLATLALIALEVNDAWRPYAVHAVAAFAAGALMVALAPLRPWREPAAAGVLAVAAMAGLVLVRSELAVWLLGRALQPWYAGVGVAAGSGAMAAAGGLAVRRFTSATTRTDLLLVLSAFVTTGTVALMALMARSAGGGLLLALIGVAAGGFVTQAAIAPQRLWACGAGGLAFVLFALADGFTLAVVVGLMFGGPILVLIGFIGAALAWRLLRRGDPTVSTDVPPARLG